MRDGSELGAPITGQGAAPSASDSGRAALECGSRPISAAVLTRIFLEIGATSFGGLGPSLAIIERELVAKRSILTPADVAEAVAATRLLPGSTLIQVASFLGYRIRGWPGSAVATLACIIPPASAMIVLAACCQSLPSHPALGPATQGLTASVVGLLLASMCRFGRATLTSGVAAGIGLVAFGSAVVWRIPAAVVVVIAGLIGILLLPTPRTERQSESARGGRS